MSTELFDLLEQEIKANYDFIEENDIIRIVDKKI